MEEYLVYIRRNQLLQDLTADEMALILSLTQVRDYPAGAVVMREGEMGDSLYIMCEGQVEVSKRLLLEVAADAPREKVMTRLQAETGIVLGEMAVIDKEVRSATVITLTPCRLLELSQADFYRILQERPELGVKLLLRLAKLLSRRLRQSSEEIVKLTTALAIALES